MFWYYHVVIKQTICACRWLLLGYSHIYFFRIRFGYTLFRLRIKFSDICVYAHTCAFPDKAAQMYFGSMNYASRIYITSNYHIVIKSAFLFARTTCARQTFSGKVDRNIWLNFNLWFFFSLIWTLSRRYMYGILWRLNRYINTVSANYVTDFAIVRSIVPFTQD